MPQISISSGATFRAEENETLLDAAIRSGVAFPYSCKTGRCSTCKCKVLRGETHVLHPEAGLSDDEKKRGWILGCVRSADSDTTLEVDDLGSAVLPPVKTLPCRISHLELLAPDVLRIRLRLPPTADFRYIPGQYVDVIGPNGIRRSYSLANASSVDKILELHIRAVDGGAMSDYWFRQAKVNDLLRLNGPLGTFFLRDIADVDLIFLATGTGIAPVKAMLESIADRPKDHPPRSVTILWGGRSHDDFYFDVNALPGDHSFVPVLSRADAGWVGARGYVQDVLLAMRADFSNATAYVCGSEAMIRGVRDALIPRGLPENRLYSDAFVCSSNP